MKRAILFLLFCFCSIACYCQCHTANSNILRDSKVLLIDNYLFTKNVALYVRVPKGSDAAKKLKLETQIKNAYISALTLWGVSLMLVKKDLPTSVNKYLTDYTFIDGAKSIYNAPLVDIVSCEHDASVIVDLINKGNKNFSNDNTLIALSQMPGRYITLNCLNHGFYYRQNSFSTTSNDSLNLVVVLAHEIGHSLGLSHNTHNDHSIMSPDFNDLIYNVLAKDGANFAAILTKSINGPAPGVYNASACSGLRRGKN